MLMLRTNYQIPLVSDKIWLTKRGGGYMVKKKGLGASIDMKLLICDDSTAFAIELERRIEDICAYEDWPFICAVYNSANEALCADLSDVKVAFLDIELPDGDGIELAAKLHAKYPELILVFVSAYIKYAPAGYKVEAFRYLLKSRLNEELREILKDVLTRIYSVGEVIRLKTRDDLQLLPLRDILYFEGTGKRMVLAHLCTQPSTLDCFGKLSELEEQLSHRGFLRLQKSYLVNMAHVKRLSGYRAVMTNGRELKVSELNYPEIRERYLVWKGRTI